MGSWVAGQNWGGGGGHQIYSLEPMTVTSEEVTLTLSLHWLLVRAEQLWLTLIAQSAQEPWLFCFVVEISQTTRVWGWPWQGILSFPWECTCKVWDSQLPSYCYWRSVTRVQIQNQWKHLSLLSSQASHSQPESKSGNAQSIAIRTPTLQTWWGFWR